jgi:hypothetical protein
MDSDEGRNEDPLSLHKYLYCQTDPVNNTDPSGHDIGECLGVMDIGFTLFAQSLFIQLQLRQTSIEVVTVIRPPAMQAGVKTKQFVGVTDAGKIIATTNYVGRTSVGVGAPKGVVNAFRQIAYGRDREVIVSMYAQAHSALLPPKLSIRYQFQVTLDFNLRKGKLSGFHERYPSYTVSVGGKQIYDFQQERFSGLSGRDPMGVELEFRF